MTSKKTISQLINEFILVHGDTYDYSLINDQNYKNNKTKVPIICKIHGSFNQSPSKHLYQQGCPSCAKTKKLNTKDFIQKVLLVHNNKYNYSKVVYTNSHTKVCIICPEHGEFWQIPNNHLSGQGCPKCIKSKGELLIEQWLKDHLLKFIPQKRFKGCKYKRTLPFDFYLPELNICIEFDGKQHFKPFGFGENAQEKFQRTKINDEIKNDFCKKSEIKLIRIPYWKSKNYKYLDSFITKSI